MPSPPNRFNLSRRRALGYAAAFLAAGVGGVFVRPRQSSAEVGRRGLPSRRVRLAERGGAVWAWSLRVFGYAETAVTLTVNGTPYPVQTNGQEFQAQVALSPGDNEVVAEAGGQQAVASYDASLPPRPRAAAVARLDGQQIVLDAGASSVSPGTSLPLISWRWTSRGAAALPGLPASGQLVRMARPTGPGPWYVDLIVTDRAGQTDRAGVTLLGGPVGAVPAAPGAVAVWTASAVVYGVIPYAFGPRGFADVRAALDRLQDLGVTALWLNPVFETMPDEFGYAVTDYFTIRSDYGGRAELARLIDAAHGRGMRVLFDIAANHTSDHHPYFREAQRYDTRSHQYSYYSATPTETRCTTSTGRTCPTSTMTTRKYAHGWLRR